MIWAIFGSILLVLIAYLIYDNYHIEFKYFEQKSSFNLTICQISDLHSRKLNVGLIVKMIEKYKPDVIFYTGDMVDGIKDDLKISLGLIEALKDYPSFYVLGNHELRLDRKLSSYLASLALLGVRVLDNEVVDFKGIKIKGEKPIIKQDFSKINASYADIVLTHNPEGIKKYNGKYIFSGHAHGGMFGLGSFNEAYKQYFIGNSYLNPLTKPTDNVHITNVTFEPGCRNNWHIHHATKGGGQLLICVSGSGWYQEEGREPQSLNEGDVVVIRANVKHWHGAKKNCWFSHLAMEIPGENASNEWCEPVLDEYYNKL